MKILVGLILLALCVLTKKNLKKAQKKTNLRKKSREVHTRGNVKGQEPFTEVIANVNGDGTHTFKQFHQLFENRDLSYAQIKNLFKDADINHDNLINDIEWMSFYELFLQPFQECDTDKNNSLSADETKACITAENGKFKNIQSIAEEENGISKYMSLIDSEFMNFYEYMYLRRVQNAANHCAENHLIQPHRIFCAIQITTPRTRRLTAAQEKVLYKTGVVLADGFDHGQKNGLELLEFFQVAHIYNQLYDYEITQDFMIRENDIQRAIQEQIFPKWLTPLVGKMIFEDYENQIAFPAFAGYYFQLRIFFSIKEETVNFMTYDNFKSLISGYNFPGLLNLYIDNTYIPSLEEYEEASSRIFSGAHENDYFHNYEVQVFLQKNLKTKLRKNRKTRDLDVDEPAISDDAFPTEPQRIIFNMYDSYRNESIYVKDWLELCRHSFLYLYFNPNGVQKFSQESMVADTNRDFYEHIEQNVFPLKIHETFMWTNLQDFISSHPQYTLNLKEFISFFRVHNAFEFLKQPGLEFRTSTKRTAQAFHDIGLRFTKYNMHYTLMGYDGQLADRNYQFMNSFRVAIQEDIVAQRVKLHKPSVYVHKDNKQA